MSEVALRMEQVYKKFRKGEVYNSLRDLIPALTGRVFRQQELSGRDNREFWALEDVSFEVPHGQALGIIGRNGAGKSTILKILARIMKPTKGRMVVNGRLAAIIEVTAGFHPDLTGRENIFLNGTILGMTKREIVGKLDQIIAFSGLEEFIDTPIKRYSSGMNARLGFSVAAHVDPEVLIVDEVLSVGDFAFQQRCVDRMRSILKGGTTVLFVSHNLKTVTELCQHAMLLDRGKVVAMGPTDFVVQRYLSGTLNIGDGVGNESVFISSVRVRGESGEQLKFESGDTAWVDIEVTARKDVEKLAAVIWITDESQNNIFNTSSERLGHRPFSLQAGETCRASFELILNMAHGTFGVCVSVKRNDIQREFDRRDPATMVFIGFTNSVRGAVNCFPRFVESKTATVSGTAKETVVTNPLEIQKKERSR
jgi:ABC-type polysaccharide/polyol phosphate transport system ATPase subunit